MSNVTLALLASLGLSAWLFAKFMRRSGGSTRNSLLAAGVMGVLIFFIVWSIASLVENSL